MSNVIDEEVTVPTLKAFRNAVRIFADDVEHGRLPMSKIDMATWIAADSESPCCIGGHLDRRCNWKIGGQQPAESMRLYGEEFAALVMPDGYSHRSFTKHDIVKLCNAYLLSTENLKGAQ